MISKNKILSAALATALCIGTVTSVVSASSYVYQGEKVYVVNWENYDYSHGYEGGVTLEDERGLKPMFTQNNDNDLVSTVLTVKGEEDYGFSFNNNRVKVYDFNTRKEITNGLLRSGQKVYIVSRDDPSNITLSISPANVIEN